VGGAPLPLVLAAGGAALLVALPLIWTLGQAAGVSWAAARALLLRPLVGELLANTLGITVATTLLAGVVGTLAAFAIERTDVPFRRGLTVLAALPLAIPPFVSSFGWVSLSPRFEGFWGALLVVGSAYMPLVFLPVAAALRGLDPALEQTARALGLSPWACLRRVVLPQLRPALFGGMLLVALNTLVEFGAFTLLRFRTFTTALFVQYRTGAAEDDTALLAAVLLLFCFLCLAAELRVRGTARLERVGRFTRRAGLRLSLGPARWAVLAAFAALALATVGVPAGMIALWLTRAQAASVSPSLATLATVAAALLSSLRLAALGTAVTLGLALPVALLAGRHPGRLSLAIERAACVGQGVPAIVVALALVSLSIRGAPFLYQSEALLALAYAIVFLPLATVGIRAALAQAPVRLEQAGRSLGLGPGRAFLRITLPLAAPGLGAAAALVFVSIVTELTSTLLLAPIGTRTLATELWADTTALAFAAAAPYAAAMAVLSLASTWLMATRFGAAIGTRAPPG
jgi:iron(III) transport system permease protein